MALTIIPYESKFKSACISAFKSNVPEYFTSEEIQQFESFLDHFEENVYPDTTFRRTYFYVLVKNGELIGCGGFGDKDGDHRISLAWGLIHRDFHRQSFGKLLLQFRLKEIRNYFPGSIVYLDTTQHSSPFYEKLGFKLNNILPNFFEKGMHKHELSYFF